MLRRCRVAIGIALIALAAVPAAALGEDDAGPKPPFEGDPGNIGVISVTGGGTNGKFVTGSFAPAPDTTTWAWSWTNGTKVSGCGVAEQACVLRVTPQSVASKFDPATGRWEANFKTQSGWSPLAVTLKDPGEYPSFTRDWFKVLFGPAAECLGPGIATPPPRIVSGGKDWSFLAEVSATDGLVVRDVKLGERKMAARMSLPYYTYALGALGTGRAELVVNGSQAVARSRLLAFDAAQGPQGVSVRATYGVDQLPGDGCMEVTQEYRFDNAIAGDHCEPAGKLPCARFVPTVSYKFLRKPEGMGTGPFTLAFPQRLEFVDEAAAFNAAALALDQDSPAGTAKALGEGVPAASAPIIRSEVNPLLAETAATVIRGGVASTTDAWDNFHQTYFCKVQLPRAFAPENVVQGRPFGEWLAVPGCPECIHMHWRWGAPTVFAPGFNDANAGRPRIPAGSAQDVTVGIVRVQPGSGDAEADPRDWRELISNDDLGTSARDARELPAPGRQARIAFWYEGAGHQDADSFLTHGGFFAVDEPGKATVSQAALSPSAFRPAPTARASAVKPPARKGGATLRFKLSEWGALLGQIEARRPGVKVKGRCVQASKKRRGKPCTRTVVFDDVTEDGGKDQSSVEFTGRVGKKALAPGSYRLVVRGRDLSGDVSPQRVLPFRILPAAKAR